ncbi:hypothetical protein [Nonomuraea sp. NPDC003754]
MRLRRTGRRRLSARDRTARNARRPLPGKAAQKIAANLTTLGANCFDSEYGNGSLTAIEL